MRRAGISPDPCDKYAKATVSRTGTAKEDSPKSESWIVECGEYDRKRQRVGRFDGEKESGSAVCAGDKVEGEQV